jgi:hypothetical protein
MYAGVGTEPKISLKSRNSGGEFDFTFLIHKINNE